MNLNSFRFIIYFAALFVVMVMLQLLRKKSKAIGTAQLILLLAFSYFFILKSDWRFCICIAAVTLLTYALGLLIEKTHSKKFLTGGGIALLIICAFFSTLNDPIGMYINQYGNRFLFFFVALIGILGTICISFRFESSEILLYFGRNSIMFYATHFFTLRVIKAFLVRMVGSDDFSVYPLFLLAYMILIPAETTIVWFINKKTPWMFGKKTIS